MTIIKTATLPVSTDEAFALITQPERLRRWMGVTARLDLRAGGDFRWTVTPGNIAFGTVTEVEPGRRVVFDWRWAHSEAPEGSSVTIAVEPAGAETLVTLTHEGLSSDEEVGHTEGWNHFFERLEKAAVDGDAGPDEWAASPENLDLLTAAEATLAVLQSVLINVSDDELNQPTPCAEFNGHELAEHLLGSVVAVGAMGGVSIVDPGVGTLESRVADMSAEAIEAWRSRGLEGTVDSRVGEIPATMAVSILSIEFLIHAWDFAQASGQTVTVSDDVVAFVREHGGMIIEGSRERGAFGAEVDAGESSSALDQLVAFAGRRPLAQAALS